MPLNPQYQWSETESTLEVTVDVPGVSRAKADVFATDAFLKVNCPPYLFALDLAKEVDDSRSSATLVTGAVVFKLCKREPGIWGVLAATGDKAELTARRNASIDRAYAAVEAARKARLDRRQQEDKAATQRSMDVDRRKRQEVERRKAAELAEERGRLESWKQGLERGGGGDDDSDYEDEPPEEGEGEEGQGAEGQGAGPAEDNRPEPDHPDYHGRGWRASGGPKPSTPAPRGGQKEQRGGDADSDSSEDEAGRGGRRRGGEEGEHEHWPAAPAPGPAPKGESFKPLPPPRATLQPVQVNFTKLETGHLPAREQREDEIRAFRKQARSAAPDPDAPDLAERQPLFLKDKGDALFRAGNYAGAVNAYTRALSIDDSISAIHSNRAAARLASGDPAGAAADCDRALDLLAESRTRLDQGLVGPDEGAGLRKQLTKLLVRRAQARVEAARAALGGAGAAAEAGAAALRDYQGALSLSPQDAGLRADAEELAASLQPADAAALRQRGDARFRSGDYEGAAEAFGALVSLPRGRVPVSERLAAFSNRAAALLVLERYAAAIADADAGLALLLPTAAGGGGGGGGGGGSGGAEFGAAAGEAGMARLTAWAEGLRLPSDEPAPCSSGEGGQAPEAGSGPSAPSEDAEGQGHASGGMAPAAAAAAAARLLSRRGAAAAHLQRFSAAAADYGLATALLLRLGEAGKAAAAAADAERMVALAEGREALPPRPTPLTPPLPPPQPAATQEPRPTPMAAAEPAAPSSRASDGEDGELEAQAAAEGAAGQAGAWALAVGPEELGAQGVALAGSVAAAAAAEEVSAAVVTPELPGDDEGGLGPWRGQGAAAAGRGSSAAPPRGPAPRPVGGQQGEVGAVGGLADDDVED
ncbi:hypothetical protein HYH03_013797 [Edaphochlamys debaryana]|uniref:Dynein axonemal assembly factor 4 n=1 Tax=Edaphochlamys debaryana TaxID=47281 RepID=A0A836BSV8_9CHLO|nr:hypothetical protein HYH03_013797 [Edaphochlamys debaryana]|eukprot:KAG2487660.1 hypothetical protein HYH03_013797 [Edaphochlamys debaryana]